MSLPKLISQIKSIFPTAKIVVEYDSREYSWSVAKWFVQITVDSTRFGIHYGYSDVSFEEAAQIALDKLTTYFEKVKQ